MPKQICAHKECKVKIKMIEMTMGTCRCQKVFCVKHRLPESHNCPVIIKFNKDDFVKSNLCVASKIETI